MADDIANVELQKVAASDGAAQTIRRIDNSELPRVTPEATAPKTISEIDTSANSAELPPELTTDPVIRDMVSVDSSEVPTVAVTDPTVIQNSTVVANEPLQSVYSFGTTLEALATRGAGVGGGTTASANPSPQTGTTQARTSGFNNIDVPFPEVPDWRFRISLAAGSNYLYNADKVNGQSNGILYPLKATNGVIFPYTPQISVTYSANYEPTDLPHSNYKMYNYRNSAVENISIVADFTAQDTAEANYLLAVIHFFRSVTKMFYGKDNNPTAGVPPPLCYLTGYGDYAFDHHPVVVNSFTLTYPTDVDYINAGVNYGTTSSSYIGQPTSGVAATRLLAAKLRPGGLAPAPGFTQSAKLPDSTRVPTRITLQIGCLPIVTRDNLSNNFSLQDYASGKLLKSNNNSNGGMW